MSSRDRLWIAVRYQTLQIRYCQRSHSTKLVLRRMVRLCPSRRTHTFGGSGLNTVMKPRAEALTPMCKELPSNLLHLGVAVTQQLC